ncbi:MAG: hypothetical protein WCA22_07545 [Candidatus Binatus sp.]
MPLIDASGSTIALVNAASTQSQPATTYTYDPSGTRTLSGATTLWPFLYGGMEQEPLDAPYYYTGSGQFYSPQMPRPPARRHRGSLALQTMRRAPKT